MPDPGTVFTVGHSTHEFDAFVGLLREHNVSAIADVRSTPASRFNPQFNRDALSSSLGSMGISYVFLGKELGARSDDRNCYVDGTVQFDRLAEAPAYQEGLDRIESGRAEHRIAIMCAERDPLDCHRAILISESLASRGVPIVHILGGGRLEDHEQARMRLRELHGLAEEDLLHSADELTRQALRRQEGKIAYADDSLREVMAD
ncbi:DUF488 family protein [Nocardioides sp. YIM B13467]|uniref:DUF488 domain-containing protein n=1 Tax=Nocardioides sp. YIM B13467 TaxID=3366294 RepID=UPI003670A069